MTQGDGMGELSYTAEDMEFAAQLWRALRAADDEATAVGAIVACIAAERQKARAPFLALADEWEEDVVGAGWDEHANGKAEAAADIRRAAEVGE